MDIEKLIRNLDALRIAQEKEYDASFCRNSSVSDKNKSLMLKSSVRNSRSYNTRNDKSNGRRTIEDIRASFVDIQNSAKVAKEEIQLRTDEIPLISHTHGRQRRYERNIQRRELQAAIKYGSKEVANPGRDGSKRWRYTYNGVVYITDETSRHEVTSWRIDGENEEENEEENKLAEIKLAGSGCHAVLVIDNSGSMRQPDVPGYKSRAEAVYECLKRDFVREQLKTGSADDVVVSVISMSNNAYVLLDKKPLGESLIDDLQRLSKRRPNSHGNYIPALDKALEIMKKDAPNRSSILLLFFSDGAPSDQMNMKCEHGINVFLIDRKEHPFMQHRSKGAAWNCRKVLCEKVEKECCQRIKRIGQVFGRDKVVFRTLAFGPPHEDFRLLEKMANVLPRGEFQKLGLNVKNLKTAFSSLSSSLLTLRTEQGHRTLTRRSDKVVQKDQKVDNNLTFVSGEKGWWIYANEDFIGKYEYDQESSRKLKRRSLVEANGIAFLQHPFAEGAERFVYRCTEIFATEDEYYYAAFEENEAWRVGLRLVAKEAKDVENLHKGRKFHQTFARIQSDAANLANAFTEQLPNQKSEWMVSFLQTSIYGCYDTSYENGQAWILVEPELDGKFTKWNNNAGEVRSIRTKGTLAQTSNRHALNSLLVFEEEDEEEEEEYNPIEIDDIPQAFSHFSYENSKGKKLVCDLQGVWNADDGFVLTDTVVHYISSTGRTHINGATDKGLVGVRNFFKTHVCNPLCRKMGLPPRKASNLIPVVSIV